MINVAIQGQKGSFHAQAAAHYFNNKPLNIINCHTFSDVFESLGKDQTNFGVVAIENSLYGSINEVYDLLLKHKFTICGEIFLRIEHHLLAIAGTKISDIKEIYSQIPALDQCKDYMSSHLPGVERIEYYDTAASAELVAKSNNKIKAAIAGSAAAKEYNLSKIVSNIEDNQQNYTRFIILQKNEKSIKLSQNCKISITFTTSHSPGSLYKVLSVFADSNINLTKLESRPFIGKAWHYIYYLDFEADINNADTKNVLDKVRILSGDLHILGCYPAGKIVHEI